MGTHGNAVPRPIVSASGVSRPQRAFIRGNARSQAGKKQFYRNVKDITAAEIL